MPIYEYECNKCGRHVEALQKFSDPPIAKCEICHSNKIKKLISHSAFHLKGTGWYVTDYASKSGATYSGGKEASSGGDTQKASAETKSSDDSTSKKDAPASSNSKE
ncbi:MAG: zinc ribbon domain-containing protein [Proteobacteria bacterium]|nr:zinc ribbon domain-containing protein [Pseudomonadota bacterium]